MDLQVVVDINPFNIVGGTKHLKAALKIVVTPPFVTVKESKRKETR
jgi:hypothetical protein